MHRIALTLVAASVITAAPVARAAVPSLTVEGYGGWQNLRPAVSSAGNAIGGREGTATFGGDVLLNLMGLGVGVSVDKAVSGSFSGQPWAGTLMAGFLVDIVSIRLELLGELGRRGGAFDDLFKSSGQTIVGLRPGVSLRLAMLPLRVGLSGLVRWPTSGGDFGSPDYGLIGRVGVEFP